MALYDKTNSFYTVFVILTCEAAALFQLGIGLTVLNNAGPALTTFIKDSYEARYNVEPTSQQVNLMSNTALTAYDIGSMFGALGAKYTTSYFSRKGSIGFIHALWLVSALLMSPVAALTNSVEAVIVGRVVAGVARGVSLSVIPLYVSEITGRKMLACYQTIITIFIEFGLIMGSMIGAEDVLGKAEYLPMLFALPAIFSALFVCILPWFPQSPSWIVMNKEQNKLDVRDPEVDFEELESYRTLRKLRCGSNDDVMKEYQIMVDEIYSDSSAESATLWEFFKIPHYRRQLFAGIVIIAGPQLSGMTLIFYFSDAIFRGAGIPDAEASAFTTGLFVLMLICTMISFPFITKFGAKKVFVYGGCLVIPGLVMMTLSSMVPAVISNHGNVSLAASVMVIVGGIGPKQTFSILPAELTTYVTRPLVLWLSTLIYYISAVCITFITPFAVDAFGGYAYIPYVVLFVAVLSYVQFGVPETHGKSSYEIQQSLKNEYMDIDEEKRSLLGKR